MGHLHRAGILFLLSAATLGSCGGSSSGPGTADLAGTWLATKFEFRSTTSPAVVDLVALGGSATLVLDPAGTYVLTARPPGEPAEVIAGTWEASSDVMTIRRPDRHGEMQFDMELAGDVLRLTGADAEFDFNGDDRDDPAKLSLELRR